MPVPTFVDLQGYPIGQEFLLKEVAVLRGGTILAHYVFSTPMPWSIVSRNDRRCIKWLVRNHHGLAWEDGDVPYCCARHLIIRALQNEEDCYDRAIVYVKGLEKRRWLLDILEDDDNIYEDDNHQFYIDNLVIKTMEEDFEDLASLNDLKNSNTFHCRRHRKNCAMQNVFKLYNWWRTQQN